MQTVLLVGLTNLSLLNVTHSRYFSDISFIKFIFTGESILSKSKEDALLPEKLTEKVI